MKLETQSVETVDSVVLDDENCTILTLCDRLSQEEHEGNVVCECCAPCPNYTTVPCSC